MSPRPANQFSRDAKISEQALIRVAYFFCIGLPVGSIAKATGLSAKTVRAHILAFRSRIATPHYNRWHGLDTMLLKFDPEIADELIKPALLDLMAECHGYTKCAQNYRLGYRKRRLCRPCPLAGKFTGQTVLNEALHLIDTVRAFYASLGIRAETHIGPIAQFRERLAHVASVTTAWSNSLRRGDGLPDPADKSDLSVGVLLDRLLTDLAEEPL